MKISRSLILGLLLLSMSNTAFSQPSPPRARQIPKITEIHRQKLVDNYFWLRNRQDPHTMAYLQAENKYCDQMMAPTQKLQKKLYQEMLSRIKEDDQQAPYQMGSYSYFTRNKKGQAYPIYCRQATSKSTGVEVLLDLNALARGQKYLGLGSFAVSPNGQCLAYSLDLTGYRQYRLHFKDLLKQTVLPDSLERVTSVAWASDNQTIFYTSEDAVTKRSDKFWKYTVGSNKPELLYQEDDEIFDLTCSLSRDQSLVLLHCFSKTSTELKFCQAQARADSLRTVRPRQANHEYWGDFYRDRFIIRSNFQAPMFKLVSASLEQPQQWHDLLLPGPETQIDQFCIFPQHLAVILRNQGVAGLAIADKQGQDLKEVHFKENVRSLTLGDNEDPELSYVRVEYESPITPATTYNVNLQNPTAVQLRQQPVPNYQASLYTCQRLLVKVRDGAKVPVTLVYRQGCQADGSHPLLLEGYGSYGSIDDPSFSSTLISLLDRGVIYAYAHIRGGGELGEPWRLAGRMMQKMNTFNDFVDCGQYLIDNGWSRTDGLVITGGSAGGLLVGAAVNQRPQIFKAAVCKVPFVDVINTMLDASLPLTTAEYVEWGNPQEPSAFAYMMQYSPYDQLRARAYPSMLVKISVNDSQVPYWEGAKFVAKMRALKTDHNPLLLKVNMSAGHGGSSGRYIRLQEKAFDYAYILWQMGLLPKN